MNELERIFFFHNPDKKLEKVVIGGWDEKKHLTLRIWNEKQEIDLHLTDDSIPEGNQDRYKTLFKISFDRIKELGEAIEKFDFSIIESTFNTTISAGKLNRYNCYLQYLPKGLEELQRFFSIKGNGRRGRFKKGLEFKDIEDHLIWPAEIDRFDSGAFLVYKIKNGKHIMNGFVYRHQIHKGTRKFIYLSKRKMNLFHKEIILFFFSTLEKIDFENKEWVMSRFNNMINKRFPLYKP